ncbi:pyocin knob domain-containing protein, partial [Apilactobacillus timberlakei]
KLVDITKSGQYILDGNPNNWEGMPDNGIINSWLNILEVKYFKSWSGFYTRNYVLTTSTSMILTRSISTVGGDTGWQLAVSKDDTNKLSDRINDLSDKSIVNRGSIPVDDLNDLTQTGFYADENTVHASFILKNNPDGSSGHCYVRVTHFSNNMIKQSYCNDHFGSLNYERYKINGIWTNWKQLTTTDDTAALSDRIDKAQDQLGADIRDAEQRANAHSDEKIKFFDSLDQVNSTTAPEGTLAIVKE